VDGKRDGNVTGEEANRYVVRALRTVQAQGQTPQLASSDASKLVLAQGVKEVGPSAEALRALREAAGGPTASVAATSVSGSGAGNASGGSAGGDMAADIAALKRAKAMVAAREAKLVELSAAKASEGAAAWRELSGVLSDGSAAEKALVEKYVATWSAAKVWVDDAEGRAERAVAVAEVATAKAWLAKSGKGAGGGSDWTSPTLGTMKWIPAGTFTMGSPASEAGRSDNEVQHRVTLTRGYWLMDHEVTQGEWQSVMGSNPSEFTKCGAWCPVEQVSWADAVEFAKRVSARDGVAYRLPTESEWEYAARGGQEAVYAGSSEVTSVGWIDGNSGSKTHPVCQKGRNGYGLCDMTGNVWEWTSDWYGAYPSGSVSDPTGASSGSYRVFRGGCWGNSAQLARVAFRYRRGPADRSGILGFRLARTSP
jgi:formylglycine-generating enzyme required for sulfatase activity